MFNIRYSKHLSLTTLLLCAALLGMTACAQLEKTKSKTSQDTSLVFPSPPDEPRFVYEQTIGSSADVETEKSNSQLKELLTGEGAASGDPIRKPYGVAVHKGRIFVSDSVSRIVRVFDVAQGRFFIIGDNEPGLLMKPLGLDVDAAGNLYVADISAKYIMVYDRDGKFLRKVGGPSFFARLTSASVDKQGERIYAVDIGGSIVSKPENHRVRVFNAKTGEHLFDFGKRGTGPGEFNLPRDLAVGKDGNLYVVDGGNFRIQVFTKDGKYIKSFGQLGSRTGDLGRPKEIDIDGAGNVYVVDSSFGNIQIFNSGGELLMFIGFRSEDPGPAHFLLPEGIAVDEDGRIYVADQWYRKIDIFRPVGLGANEGYLRMKAPKVKK